MVIIILTTHSSPQDDIQTLDLILSSSFFLSFLGLKERKKLFYEQSLPYFPNDYPDTLSYQQYSNQLKQELQEKYNKRPPAKRVNYSKLKFANPFSSPWDELSNQTLAMATDSTNNTAANNSSNNNSNNNTLSIQYYILRGSYLDELKGLLATSYHSGTFLFNQPVI